MPFQPIIPTWLALNAANDPSASGFTDLRTGQPVNAGGLKNGDFFDLTNKEALQLTYQPAANPGPRLYAGRYRRIQVDSGATASNVKTGTIGLMVAGLQPDVNIVTSYDKGIVGAHVVVFLNAITPGNYGFVQELGYASVLAGATLQKAVPATGDLVDSTTLGVLQDLTAQTVNKETIGIALSPPSPNTLCLVQLKLTSLQG